MTVEYKASVAFVDDNLMRKLNKGYRNQKGSTDVLSFDVQEFEKEGVFLLGEVVINLSRAEKQAKDEQHSLEEEIGDLFKHGILHLLGKHHLER